MDEEKRVPGEINYLLTATTRGVFKKIKETGFCPMCGSGTRTDGSMQHAGCPIFGNGMTKGKEAREKFKPHAPWHDEEQPERGNRKHE